MAMLVCSHCRTRLYTDWLSVLDAVGQWCPFTCMGFLRLCDDKKACKP